MNARPRLISQNHAHNSHPDQAPGPYRSAGGRRLRPSRWMWSATAFSVLLGVGAELHGQDTSGPSAELYSTMEWRLIGPFRGGRSVAVTGVLSDPSTYYFGGVGGGIWKTTDAGLAWTNVSDGFLNTASVGALAVAPSDPNVVYAGMGEHAPRGVTTSHGDGVYRSTDAGRTWTHLGLEATRAISRIIVHPGDPDWVYVAAQGAPYGPSEDRGIYRSKDGGRQLGEGPLCKSQRRCQ